MKTLNRAGVVVTPKQGFLDWLRGLDESNRELTTADLCRDPSIYLFPVAQYPSSGIVKTI